MRPERLAGELEPGRALGTSHLGEQGIRGVLALGEGPLGGGEAADDEGVRRAWLEQRRRGIPHDLDPGIPPGPSHERRSSKAASPAAWSRRSQASSAGGQAPGPASARAWRATDSTAESTLPARPCGLPAAARPARERLRRTLDVAFPHEGGRLGAGGRRQRGLAEGLEHLCRAERARPAPARVEGPGLPGRHARERAQEEVDHAEGRPPLRVVPSLGIGTRREPLEARDVPRRTRAAHAPPRSGPRARARTTSRRGRSRPGVARARARRARPAAPRRPRASRRPRPARGRRRGRGRPRRRDLPQGAASPLPTGAPRRREPRGRPRRGRPARGHASRETGRRRTLPARGPGPQARRTRARARAAPPARRPRAAGPRRRRPRPSRRTSPLPGRRSRRPSRRSPRPRPAAPGPRPPSSSCRGRPSRRRARRGPSPEAGRRRGPAPPRTPAPHRRGAARRRRRARGRPRRRSAWRRAPRPRGGRGAARSRRQSPAGRAPRRGRPPGPPP
jgi:hypothetical protein